MQPEPLFQSFDAGWVPIALFAVAAIAFGFAWLVEQIEPWPDLDDDAIDYDCAPERRSIEDEARRNPF